MPNKPLAPAPEHVIHRDANGRKRIVSVVGATPTYEQYEIEWWAVGESGAAEAQRAYVYAHELYPFPEFDRAAR